MDRINSYSLLIDRINSYSLLINMININDQIKDACANGNINQCQLLIRHGACDFDRGLAHACKNAHINAAQLMIDHGAKDYDWALRYACIGGDIDIVKFILTKNISVTRIALYNAITHNHTQLFKMLFGLRYNGDGIFSYDDSEKVGRYYGHELDEYLYVACGHGNMDLTTLIIQHSDTPDISSSLVYACKRFDNHAVTKYLISLDYPIYSHDLSLCYHYVHAFPDNHTMVRLITTVSLNYNMKIVDDNDFIDIIKRDTALRRNETAITLNNLTWPSYDINIITPLICEYVPHEY